MKSALNVKSLKVAPAILAAAALLFSGVGCSESEIKVYRLAKEESGRAATSSGSAPAGWLAQPATGMRAYTYLIQGTSGGSAEVSIIPLRGVTGIERESVNIWRAEIGLPEVEPAAFGSMGRKVPAGHVEGMLYELAPADTAATGAQSTIGVIADHEGDTWFFKMTGAPAIIQSQRESFLAYVAGFDYHAAPEPPAMSHMTPPSGGAPMASGTASGGASRAGLPEWDAPESWQPQPATSFRLASFNATNDQGQTADISVSKLAGDGGGMLMNVNRWRVQQLGLPAVTAEELPQVLTELDAGASEAKLVDMEASNGQDRMMTAIVERPGETWFYKMAGPKEVVGQERERFLNFVKSAQY